MSYTLRVSVLEHCQLRCNYCLPPTFSASFNKTNWLSLDQYEKIATALSKLPIRKIRFTGGEPLFRPELSSIIKIFSQIFFDAELALTTNGLRFLDEKDALLRSGLKQITFHLDTLKNERYARLMGRGSVEAVLNAVEHAQDLGLQTKINVVVQRHLNDDELWDFLLLSQKLSVPVRFIELMNTGSARDFVSQAFISGQEILEKISRFTTVNERGRKELSTPAEEFFAKDLDLTFGLIASDTRPFCAHCNRLRLSADGRLRTCLYEPLGQMLPFKTASFDDLLAAIDDIVARKTSFHPMLKKNQRAFSMSQIGG